MCCSATSSIRPRGRIYLIKDMLENDRPATADVVKHIDRCLSCLACMTTCPSGVHYMHLVDHARAHIESTYRRPLVDRVLRALLRACCRTMACFRWALAAARLAKPFAGTFAALGLAPVAAMLRLAPPRLPPKAAAAALPAYSAGATDRAGAGSALLSGCVGPVHRPLDQRGRHPRSSPATASRWSWRRRAAAARWSTIWAAKREALAAARRQIDAWTAEIEGEGLDAILVTASGCGTTVKDYGFMLRTDRAYADKAARVSRLAMDISEYLGRLELASERGAGGPCGRLSFRLLAPARTENRTRAERIAFQESDS